MEPQPDWIEEIVRRRTSKLSNENDQLRTLLVEALRAMKEVELTLQSALDRDKK